MNFDEEKQNIQHPTRVFSNKFLRVFCTIIMIKFFGIRNCLNEQQSADMVPKVFQFSTEIW